MKYEKLQQAHTLVDGYSQAEQDVLKPFLPELPKQKTLEEILDDVYKAYLCEDDKDNTERLEEIYYQLENLSKATLPQNTVFSFEDYENLPDGSVVLGLGEPRIKAYGVWHFGLNDYRSDKGMAGAIRYIVRKGNGLVQ